MTLELLIIVAIAFALLVFAVIGLFANSGLKRGTLPGGVKLPNRATSLTETWVKPPTSVPQGTQDTFTFTVTFSQPSGPAQPVAGHEYLFVVQPSANVTIVSANGASVNDKTATAMTDRAGRVDLVIKTDKGGEGQALVLAGRNQQQIRQAKLMAAFTIPVP